MGAFFTNVQLRRGPTTSLEKIASALDALAQQAGLVRGAADIEACDRTMVVRAGPGDWISVYDEGTEEQNLEALEALATALSAATDSTAVSILVHDSDVLLMGLFVRGKKVDMFNNDPRYFEGTFFEDEEDMVSISDDDVDEASGHPERWKHLLVPGTTADMLARVWQEKTTFAEEMLARVAELLGCSPDRVRVGLNDFDFGEVPSAELLVLQYVYGEEDD